MGTTRAYRRKYLSHAGQADIEESIHFLPDAQRGVPRRNEDVNLGRSAYLPPFRPESDYIARCFEQIVACAKGLPPISFVDFDRADYIRGMAAFYELGTTQLFEKVFVEGYVKSIVRSSDIPAAMKTGRLPEDVRARGFILRNA